MKLIERFEVPLAYLLGYIVHGFTPLQTYIFSGIAVVGAVLMRLSIRRMKRELKAVQKHMAAEPRPRPEPESKSTITLKQMMLVDELSKDESTQRGAALAALWADIYGKPADMDRPVEELAAEVLVALSQMSS